MHAPFPAELGGAALCRFGFSKVSRNVHVQPVLACHSTSPAKLRNLRRGGVPNQPYALIP